MNQIFSLCWVSLRQPNLLAVVAAGAIGYGIYKLFGGGKE
jgi:hypothetical protein